MKGLQSKAISLFGRMNKKGQAMQAGVNWLVGLLVFVVVLALLGIVLTNLNNSATGAGANATVAGIRATNAISDLTPNIGTIIAVGVILIVLVGAVGFFLFRKQ